MLSQQQIIDFLRRGGQALVLKGDKGDSIKGDKGEKGLIGLTGPSNSLTIGTVTTGTPAKVTITGTSPNQKLNFVVPAGTGGGGVVDGGFPESTYPGGGIIDAGSP